MRRVIADLYGREWELAAAGRRIDELNEALLPRFGVERLREPGNRIVRLSMEVDEYTAIHARLPLVEQVLALMGREWQVWFKNVGDLERIQADHATALMMDSERYVFLTQQFDAKGPFIKERNAPWDKVAT